MTDVRKNEEQHRYEVLVDNQVVGFAEYREMGDSVMMPHTEVSEAHEGEGLGNRLAEFALQDVQQAGKHVIPMCPFISAYIKRHPDYIELVQPAQRAMFRL